MVHVLDAAARDQTGAGMLVAALVAEYAGRECRIVNEPDGSALVDSFLTVGLVEVLAQYEMHWHA